MLSQRQWLAGVLFLISFTQFVRKVPGLIFSSAGKRRYRAVNAGTT